LIFPEQICHLHGLRLLRRDIQRIDQLIDRFGGILLGDIGKVCIDGRGCGAAVAENPLDMAEA